MAQSRKHGSHIGLNEPLKFVRFQFHLAVKLNDCEAKGKLISKGQSSIGVDCCQMSAFIEYQGCVLDFSW